MRDLNQHAAAVARLGIGADRAAMIEIAQNLEAHRDHFVRLAVAHVRDETHPAGGMLLDGRIKALRGRQARIWEDRAGDDRIRHLSPSFNRAATARPPRPIQARLTSLPHLARTESSKNRATPLSRRR